MLFTSTAVLFKAVSHNFGAAWFTQTEMEISNVAHLGAVTFFLELSLMLDLM